MAETTIEWTSYVGPDGSHVRGYTFNTHIGCQEVSSACDFCYARVMNERWGWVEGWGPHGERKRTSAANWRKPYAWAKAARANGTRPRVFCASLADVFDNKIPKEWRADLFRMIADTKELDWLLLTKRPENISKMLPDNWGNGWPNIWLGTTTEDQLHYDRRWRILQAIPAVVHFISYEPALGPLTLGNKPPSWAIIGGESGRTPRPMDLQWARDLRDECAAKGVAYFFKQTTGKKVIPDDLLVRQFPTPRLLEAA